MRVLTKSILGLMVALLVAVGVISIAPQTTFAAGESQIRIYGRSCSKYGGPLRYGTICVPKNLEGYIKVEGYNQYGSLANRSTGPGSIVNPLSFPNWWWNFSTQPVKVTYVKYTSYNPVRTQTYVASIQNRYLQGCRWVNVYMTENYLYAGQFFTGMTYETQCTSS